VTEASQPDASKEAVDRQWAERGWPSSLLADARRLRLPERQLEWMLFSNSPLERVELEVKWAEQLIDGTMRFRQVTFADNDAFSELWANSPEEIGEWDVIAERSPDAFAQFKLQERPVVNALFNGTTMVACVSFALRNTVVAGRRLSVRYGQAMRVHKDHRRHGYANWVRSLPWAIGLNMATEVQCDYIRADNLVMERWNRGHMPDVSTVPKREGAVPGVPVTVLQYPAKPGASSTPGVRTATPDDIPRCVALINGTHAGRDLFRPYTPEFLANRLDPGYAPPGPTPPTPVYCFDDFSVVERRGEVVACAGGWDRGRDAREHWRHRETGEKRTISVMSLLDIGVAPGHEDALAALIEHVMGVAHDRGRDYVVAPFETLQEVTAMLASHDPVPETRYLQWRAETPALTTPAHLDLAYW
jgi:hypothetical protein